MGFFDFFKKRQPSASVAKERLQILVSHERATRGAPSWLGDLKNDILEVVKKYVEVEPDAISFKVGREENRELLELNIALPGGGTKVKAEVKTEAVSNTTKGDSTTAPTDAKGSAKSENTPAKPATGNAPKKGKPQGGGNKTAAGSK